MIHSWLAYLPPHLAADLLAHPDSSPLDRVLRQQAVALFADISGFTSMSEALGDLGPRGTEELSGILNRTFGTMIARITAYGGSIGKFAGDALTILFPTTVRTQQVVLRRAIQCALDMQADLAANSSITTSAGSFSLAMKIGIGLGSLLTTTVGVPSIRLEYLLAGSAIDACAEAEQHAPKGAVVLPEALLPLTGALTSLPVAPGYQQVLRLHRRPPAVAPPLLTLPDAHVEETLRRYLPPSIAQRVATGQQGLIDEHRMVTTLFVRFGGFEYDDQAALVRLQHYLAMVVLLSDRYGGYLRQVDVGDKGSLFIVLFGAPLAHEDDTERALLCALELRTFAQQQQIPSSTGITSGKVFCGVVGSDTRREYAAIGDSVNIAARLMSAASPGQILVDAATRQNSSGSFGWRELPPLSVKGKRVPLAVAALEQLQQRSRTRLKAPSYTLPMVGRALEYERVMACINKVLAGQRQVLLITAEAGMGKSRLVAELMRSMAIKALHVLTSECLSYGIDSSYLVWQNLLRGLFGLAPGMDTDAQLAQVRQIVSDHDPALLERMPLLSPLLNLPFAESDFTRTLDAKVRKSALEALIVELLRHWAQQQPLLLILEDCHWIDVLSEEMLEAVAFGCRRVPLLLLLTARPRLNDPQGGRVPGTRLNQITDVQELHLAEFTLEETATLIRLKLERLFGDTGSVPGALLERISVTAQGNPFYIDELLNLLHDRGIDVRDAQALAQLELPNSLQRLIISRIDALEEEPKSTLKVASIIGRLFKARWLHAIYPALGSEMQIEGHLTMLRQLDLTQLERAEPEEEYLFKHIIMREVAYESLAVQTRAVLHEQIGAFIEQTYAQELNGWLDMLAYHYGNSTNVLKQREYYWRAGQAARAIHNFRTAVGYFERLLPLLPLHEQGELLIALVQSLTILGQMQRAEAYVHTALALAEQQSLPQLYAQAVYAYGELLTDIGRDDQALIYLAEAKQRYRELHDTRGLMFVYHVLSVIHIKRGAYEEALSHAHACRIFATEASEYEMLCMALSSLGTIAFEQGRYDQAIAAFEEGRAVAEQHNRLVRLMQLLTNLGVVFMETGAFAKAVALLQQSLTLTLSLGFHDNILMTIGNIGVIYFYVGDYAHARACYQAVLARLSDPMNPRLLGWILAKLGQVAREQQELAMAEVFYQKAIAVCRTFDLYFLLVRALNNLAELYLSQRRLNEAIVANTEAQQEATKRQLRTSLFATTVLAIRLHYLSEQLTAPAAVAQLEQLCGEWHQPEEQAVLAYTIWTVAPTPIHAQHVAQHYQQLHDQTPHAEYRQRYTEITGNELPAPSPLPDPPPIVYEYPLDLPTFLARVDALL